MPASVESLSYARFSERDVPWWGTGHSGKEHPVHGRYLTPDEAKANFPWHVELRESYARMDNGAFVVNPEINLVTLIHDDVANPAHQKLLGNVGKLYSPFQPDELIDFGNELVDDFGFTYDTVGDLKGHRVIFASMRVSGIDGLAMAGVSSEVDWWIVLSNSFDGSGSLRGDITPIRPVCMNTLQAGLRQAQATWKLRHIGDLQSRVSEARETLGIVTKYQQEFAETAERMADSRFELEEFEGLVQELIPIEDEMGDRARNRAENAQAQLVGNFLHSNTIDDSWRFSKWGAFNAATEWAEWLNEPRKDSRTESKDRRMLFTMFGGPVSSFRDRAFKSLLVR